MLRAALALLVFAGPLATVAAAQGSASMTSQQYTDAILHGSPSERAAEQRFRDAAGRTAGDGKDQPRRRHRTGGLMGSGQP